MKTYDIVAKAELTAWQKKMLRKPSVLNRISKNLQTRINNMIPEKLHKAITITIRQMVKGVIFGASFTSAKPAYTGSLQRREEKVLRKMEQYKNAAAIEGGITGAGGILMGLADFPILLSIKLKFLFDVAGEYGFDVNDYKERVYILHIFELAFSSAAHRKNVYLKMVDWDHKKSALPKDMNQFDWRQFQQEYRDYIDLAKMAQLVPLIGAPVGLIVNYRLLKKLGETAINAYRMRVLAG